MIKTVFEKHKDCPTVIRWKKFNNKEFPTPGLFCQCHNVFLDWLPENLAYELIDNGIVIDEPWKPSNKQLKRQQRTEQNLRNQEANKQRREKRMVK